MPVLVAPKTLHPLPQSPTDVLILDDDPGVGRLFTRLLHRAGYSVSCVHDPENFAEAYKASRPEVVIVDVILGRQDCCTVLDFLGGQKAPRVPVILTSGYDHRILALAERTAKRNGLTVAGVFEKRHDPERIVDLVRRHRVAPC